MALYFVHRYHDKPQPTPAHLTYLDLLAPLVQARVFQCRVGVLPPASVSPQPSTLRTSLLASSFVDDAAEVRLGAAAAVSPRVIFLVQVGRV